jgi:phosphomannomutase/phosphoglucomutase
MGSRKLFGTNGIRGIVNKELTPEMAVKVGSAIGTFFKTKSLLVGHDARTSGPMFAEAVISGLNAAGCDVLLAGMASTPALQFAVKNHGFDGGVIVTASHNPPEYNGIKVIWSDGIEISHEQETQIEDIYFDDKSAILVRPSGTEPVFRLYAEAKSQKRALALVEEYSSTLKKILKHL